MLEKIHAISGEMHNIENFDSEGESWILEAQWGEAYIHRAGEEMCYYLDLDESSVFSISLVNMAFKGNNSQSSEVQYVFTKLDEGRKFVLQLKTSVEQYNYVFKRRHIDGIQQVIEEMGKLEDKYEDIKNRLPYVGIVPTKQWKEYGLNDIVIHFDYSFLNFAKTPLVYLNLEGRTGYCAVHGTTNKECDIYVHFNMLATMPPLNSLGKIGADLAWDIQYCIFPQEHIKEEEEAHPVVQAYELEEELSTYEGIDDAINNKGRQLVIYEDRVIDVADFLENHPGTPIPLKDSIGQEIGRYFYGNFHQSHMLHKHTSKAYERLLSYTVGIINDPLFKQVFDINEGKTLKDYKWVLDEISNVTDTYKLLRFSSAQIKAEHEPSDLRIIGLFNKLNLYGKYLTLSSFKKDISRNYSISFCCDPLITKHHTQLVKSFLEKSDFEIPLKDIGGVELTHLTLIMKEKADFTKKVCDKTAIKSEFTIRGPFVNLYKNILYREEVLI